MKFLRGRDPEELEKYFKKKMNFLDFHYIDKKSDDFLFYDCMLDPSIKKLTLVDINDNVLEIAEEDMKLFEKEIDDWVAMCVEMIEDDLQIEEKDDEIKAQVTRYNTLQNKFQPRYILMISDEDTNRSNFIKEYSKVRKSIDEKIAKKETEKGSKNG